MYSVDCKHEELEYCPCCDHVRCKQCGRVWPTVVYHTYPTYPTWPTWPLPPVIWTTTGTYTVITGSTENVHIPNPEPITDSLVTKP